ncbi:zinc finger protein 729 [Leptopilina boulardi]|uniref:zinc finger protein 729 n=1 Tax=Leptopilina boulardi TaxID=63433 RepID=UPI0021F6926B|nr:zinc finger protein 729 [Leptopilina boulardi]
MTTIVEETMDVPEELTLHWAEDVGNVIHEEVCGLETEMVAQEEEVIGACEEVIEEAVEEEVIEQQEQEEQADTEILMVPQSSDMESIYIVPQDQGHDYFNIQVTEEVVADSWDRSGPDDGVEIPETKVSHDNLLEYDDMEIPLPIDQDSYTNTRPYPCDFCSRRFRKKANLMNHMVAHQTDRPHGCNLCGARYVRKCDLMNHLKIHAYAPSRDGLDDDLNDEDPLMNDEEETTKGRRKKVQSNTPRRRKNNTTTANKRSMIMTSTTSTTNTSGTIDEGKEVVGKLMNKSYNYVAEDIRLMEVASRSNSNRGNNLQASSSSRWTDQMTIINEPPRWPITDPTKPYVCQHCGVAFAREKALASHSRIHGGDSPLECSNCGEMYWDLNALREHVKNKHNATIEITTDEIENTETNYTGDDRFGEFFCDTCGVPFHRLDLLKRHRKTHVKQEMDLMEGSSQQHVCTVCGEWFEEALALLAHAELHARSHNRRCLLCGERCRDDADVAEHVRQNHADDAPPNTCNLCGKTCKDKRSLLKHAWIHNSDKNCNCTKCGKRFHSKARLRRHMLSHRNKNVACDECGEEFADGRTLMSHRHSHNKELGGRSFPCRECGKTFGSRSSQQIHIRIHTGERPYSCRFCWKAFADGGTLRKHERIHTGEKPYGCTICPRAFNQRVVLREHVRAHHSGPDPKCHGSMTPYLCKVCGETYATSDEIVVHIIQHCDENTALRRQPQSGPRKYKRRRKVKSHENTTVQRVSESYDIMDGQSDSDDNAKRKVARKTKAPQQSQQQQQQQSQQQQNRSNDENYQNVLKTFETSLQNVNTNIVATTITKVSPIKTPKVGKKKMKREEKKIEPPLNSTMGRSKMIHTQKTRVPVEIGTEGVKKGQKTKTMITRTPKLINEGHKLGIFPGGERNRPRTKNVSYHVENKNQITPATFPVGEEEKEEEKNVSSPEIPEEEEEEEDEENQNICKPIINVKLEPGLRNQNQNQVQNQNFNHDDKNIKKKIVNKRGRKPKGIVIKQEPREEIDDDLNTTTTDIVTEEIGQIEEEIINEQIVDGSEMEVAFEANVVATEESILPDLDKEITTEITTTTTTEVTADEIETETLNNKENVKINVKVESTPQRVVAAHNLIAPNDETAETIIPDSLESLEHTCEMCSAVFPSHAELLVHVPIHI